MDKDVLEQLEMIQRIVGNDKGVLNTSEAAKLLGISPSTLDTWRKQGIGVPYLKPNMKADRDKARVMYSILDIAKWILNQKVKTV
jgi:predicted site-specific integrase-resolvase